jgi:hypothetical protein
MTNRRIVCSVGGRVIPPMRVRPRRQIVAVGGPPGRERGIVDSIVSVEGTSMNAGTVRLSGVGAN